MQEVLNEIAPVLVQAIIAILIIVIPLVARIIIKYTKAKLAEVENKIGRQNYEAIVTMAEDIYYVVEQKYLAGLIEDKSKEFDKLLLDRVPGLSQEDIDRTREAIVGKINTYLK